jgi:hypothetical protein
MVVDVLIHTQAISVIGFSSKVCQLESNPDLPPSSISYNLLKLRSQEEPCSQESQTVWTNHVHGFGQTFQSSERHRSHGVSPRAGEGALVECREGWGADPILTARDPSAILPIMRAIGPADVPALAVHIIVNETLMHSQTIEMVREQVWLVFG